ncbi:MAG: S-layer homology domain-containing protein [Anaerovibrio sp.]
MNKKFLNAAMAAVMAAGLHGTALAAEGGLADVPKDHWSYSAIDMLVQDGIIEGNPDGTFEGGRTMSRYEMASIVARAVEKSKEADLKTKGLVEMLRSEYSDELQRLDDRVDSLEKRLDNVMLSGYVRAKYDSDKLEDRAGDDNNKHFYMDLQGKMAVAPGWDAHFESETRKGWTGNQSWRVDKKTGKEDKNDQDGTLQRIWVEGKLGDVALTVGNKWWGLGYQNIPFGHAADGISLEAPFAKGWSAKGFWLRPRQGELVTMNEGEKIAIAGVSVTGSLGHAAETCLTYAHNTESKDAAGVSEQGMSNMWAVEGKAQLAKNVELIGTYTRTNANSDNTSKAVRLNYKGTKLDDAGSFGVYGRWFDYGKYGDYSHDDEWGSLPGYSRGWVFGVKYVPYKNIEWETLYSQQKNHDGATEFTRKLFRTQVDFHF